MTILDALQLNDPQARAATAGGDIVVTAGAGSGKTRTLVGRYLALLDAGMSLRSIAAITFTEKAAREMRTRIRQEISGWLAQGPPRHTFWERAFADLDAARIGTIHSLCAQILREHPVEAARLGVMPGFGVLEEGMAAVLRARAVEETLAWAADDEMASHLFELMREFELRALVSTLLEKRLDTDDAFTRMGGAPLPGWFSVVEGWLGEQLDHPEWQGLLGTLSTLRADDPGDKLELARQAVIAHAEAVDTARRQGDLGAALDELAALRTATALTGRKANWPGETLQAAKEGMRALRAYFDERLHPLANPKNPASWALDERMAKLSGALDAVYRRALDAYQASRRAENMLDFDDLEAGALALLEDADVRATWQAGVRAVLVDEFQDTNERQREIVYALTGFARDAVRNAHSLRDVERETYDNFPAFPGTLFVVGDAKQSIYRFRGADVTVFRRVQADVQDTGGQVTTLDLTFRAHKALVELTNDLLAPILGGTACAGQPYLIPFAPLTAHRDDPREGIMPPFVEFLLGIGERAQVGRQAAAEGLAARLLTLRDEQRIEWKDVALLFRASTAFSTYEDALERAGIPFVTVAGRGFYERPEVRQLLNALSAIADPADDLAMAGLLRASFVGLTDVALYALRFPPASIVPRQDQAPCALWAMLNHSALPEILSKDDFDCALRARALVSELHDLAGRVPVATLLKRLLDRTCYRTALQIAGGGARARRNVDKLLADAHTSGLVSVREFVEYVRTLRDVGARESEAPTEAGSAVQLMTVYKSKGLEFPVVVIADAAHTGRHGIDRVLLDDRLGVTIDLRGEDGRRPASHLLSRLRNSERDEAEDRRLLYVAATRAREKLLISAHTKILKNKKLQMAGWLQRLGQVAGLDEVVLEDMPLAPLPLSLPGPGGPEVDIGCWVYPWRQEQRPSLAADMQPARSAPDDLRQDLVAPLVLTPTFSDIDGKLDAQEATPPRRVWRVIADSRRSPVPPWVLGTLTHAALRRWRFARDEVKAFLRPLALRMGVVDQEQIHYSIGETVRMLRRFRAHPLWAELDAAQRWHELPFSVMVDERSENVRVENGVIDLLYRVEDRYTIVEFKTDRLSSEESVRVHIQKKGYDAQVERYRHAVRSQLGVEAEAMWVFLNVGNRVVVVTAQ